MGAFDHFKGFHGRPFDVRAVATQTLDRYRGVLPEPLIAFWEESGWASYANGFLWVDDPGLLDDVLEDWLESSTEPSFVIARTALGHLFFWSNDAFHLLDVHHGRISTPTDDVEILFDAVLCDPTVLRLLMKDLYDAAMPRLGRPGADECFAFVPALPLGGSPSPENLRRVKLREHLFLLSQILGE